MSDFQIGKSIVLLACGSYNPPTIMHLRLFELAKDYFMSSTNEQVVGGIMSPVNDKYGKTTLESGVHRLKMVETALQSHPWVQLSKWECEQQEWTPTYEVLKHHQQHYDEQQSNCQLKLLCGADVLSSFEVPNLWKKEHMESILRDYGVVVVSRKGKSVSQVIYESDLLNHYKANIHIVREWIENDISSTKVRRALKRHESVRYLVPDSVLNYIQNQQLYC